MTKLNQLIAVSQGKKANAKKVMTDAYHIIQKEKLFTGMERVYHPKDDDGDKLPSESVKVQLSVTDLVKQLEETVSDMMDVVAGQDQANTLAKANVLVEDKVVLENIPATTLIFIEKQLTDLHTFFSKIPTLDPAEEWVLNKETGMYVSTPVQTQRTQKVQEPIVLYPATPEHPAQTQIISKDVVAGYWHTKKMSGEWSGRDKNLVLARISQLKEAVVKAREEANCVEAKNMEIGKKIFNYLLEV
jgi:hypothetical protein